MGGGLSWRFDCIVDSSVLRSFPIWHIILFPVQTNRSIDVFFFFQIFVQLAQLPKRNAALVIN